MTVLFAWIGMACWGVCFWWMHRISSRQNAMLKELHEMTTRIEHFSQAEHELIQKVHPQVTEIKERVQSVAQAVGTDDSSPRE
jgi:hypothetical protein